MPSSSTGLDRYFLVGATVHLRVRVNLPGTRTPTDPTTVVLTKLKTGNVEIAVADTTFERVEQGEYLLTIPTVGLVPGNYDIVVTLESGPLKAMLLTDHFVLKAVP